MWRLPHQPLQPASCHKSKLSSRYGTAVMAQQNTAAHHHELPSNATSPVRKHSIFDSSSQLARSRGAQQLEAAHGGQQSVQAPPSSQDAAMQATTTAPPAQPKPQPSEGSWFGLNNVLSAYNLTARLNRSTAPAQRSIDGPTATASMDASTSSMDETDAGHLQKLLFRRRRPASPAAPPMETPADLLPAEDHHVLQVLKQRFDSNSRPGARTDEFKLGLVVEGGGMRGAVTGGALMAVLDLGLKQCFDAVYGSSAGAINATYYLAEQPEGVRIYHEDIANKRFVDLNRLMKAGAAPVLDLDFLLGDVMHGIKPLDWDAVLQAEVPLKVVASSLDTLQAEILDDFADKDDLLCCLRATANIPEIVGPAVWHRGHRLVDAAVFEPIPFRAALADGCTHVLVLCSRPPPRFGTLMNTLEDVLGGAVKRAVLSPDYMRPAWRREMHVIQEEGCTQDAQLLQGLQAGSHVLPYFNGGHVCPLYPGAAAKFAPVCIDPVVLRAGVDEGYATVNRVLQPLLQGVPRAAEGGVWSGDNVKEGGELQLAA